MTDEQLIQLLRDTDPERIRWRTDLTRRLARAVLVAARIGEREVRFRDRAIHADSLRHFIRGWPERECEAMKTPLGENIESRRVVEIR